MAARKVVRAVGTLLVMVDAKRMVRAVGMGAVMKVVRTVGTGAVMVEVSEVEYFEVEEKCEGFVENLLANMKYKVK